MTKIKYIPARVRETVGMHGLSSFRDKSSEELDKEIRDALGILYSGKISGLETPQGYWSFHTQRNPTPFFLDGEQETTFHATYQPHTNNGLGEVKTVFCGDYKEGDERNILPDIAEQLSRNVIEQREWFAFPPKHLTPGRGLPYGLSRAAVVGLGGFALLATDVLLPGAGYLHDLATHLEQPTGNVESMEAKLAFLGLMGLVGQGFGQIMFFDAAANITDRIRARNE